MKKFIMLTLMLIGVIYTNIYAAAYDIDTYHSTISADYGSIYAVRGDGILCRFEIGEDNITKTEIMEQVTDVSRNYAIKEDGTLWTWDSETCIPVKVMESVKSISSCGGPLNKILIQKNDNSLWLIEENFGGQLFKGIMSETISEHGYLDNGYYSEPIKVMDNVKKATNGAYHSIVLKNDGSVWAWGDNTYGECGVGEDFFSMDNPNEIMTDVSNVFASGAASFAVKENNQKLYAWGSNYIDYLTENPIGHDIPKEYSDNVKDIVNSPGYNLLIKKDNSLWLYGDTDGNEEIRILTKKIHVPVKLYDNIDSISGIDNCFDDRFSNFTVTLNTDGQLDLLGYNDDKATNAIFKTKKISYNVRLSNIQTKEIEFEDIINLNKEEQTAVAHLAKSGVVKGVTDMKFAPDKAIDRAETAAILLRMTGKGDETAITHFTDVTTDSWYYGIAGAAQKYGIIDGYEDNTFRGEETVSDLQLAVLAARTLKNEDMAIAPYPERSITLPDNIPGWAADDISYAIKYGILTEEEAGKLSDTNGMTRGEAAVILYRLYCAV